MRPLAAFLWDSLGAPALRAAPSLQRNVDPKQLPGAAGDPGTFDDWRDYAWTTFGDLFWTDAPRCADAASQCEAGGALCRPKVARARG